MNSRVSGDERDTSARVFVVLDTKGSGRVVGVFDDEARAAEILAINPQYYRMTPLRVNEVNPECVRWVQDADGRSRLQRMTAQLRAIDEGEGE